MNLEITFSQFASGFSTIEARRSFLDLHPELLTRDAINEANALIDDWTQRDITNFHPVLRHFRNLLIRALEVGVDQAFLEFQLPSDDLMASISTLFHANTPNEVRAALWAGKAHLSQPQVIGVFNWLRAVYEDSPTKTAYLNATLEVIRCSREEAICASN